MCLSHEVFYVRHSKWSLRLEEKTFTSPSPDLWSQERGKRHDGMSTGENIIKEISFCTELHTIPARSSNDMNVIETLEHLEYCYCKEMILLCSHCLSLCSWHCVWLRHTDSQKQIVVQESIRRCLLQRTVLLVASARTAFGVEVTGVELAIAKLQDLRTRLLHVEDKRNESRIPFTIILSYILKGEKVTFLIIYDKGGIKGPYDSQTFYRPNVIFKWVDSCSFKYWLDVGAKPLLILNKSSGK